MYDANQEAASGKSIDPHGVLQDPGTVWGVLNLAKLREYIRNFSDKDAKQIDSILSTSTPIGGDWPTGHSF